MLFYFALISKFMHDLFFNDYLDVVLARRTIRVMFLISVLVHLEYLIIIMSIIVDVALKLPVATHGLVDFSRVES